MKTFSIAQAKARFSELIDRVEAGEEISITRHGKLVARLSGAPRAPRPIDKSIWSELPALQPTSEPAGSFIRRFRDDSRY